MLAALLGGIFYIAGVVCTGRLMVFKPATDAQNKMNELARVVTEVEETDDTDEEDWEPETPSIGYEYN